MLRVHRVYIGVVLVKSGYVQKQVLHTICARSRCTGEYKCSEFKNERRSSGSRIECASTNCSSVSGTYSREHCCMPIVGYGCNHIVWLILLEALTHLHTNLVSTSAIEYTSCTVEYRFDPHASKYTHSSYFWFCFFGLVNSMFNRLISQC